VPDRIQLAIDGPIATITNNNPEKHNAFDDDMDVALFDALATIRSTPSVRAVIWRGEGNRSRRAATWDRSAR